MPLRFPNFKGHIRVPMKKRTLSILCLLLLLFGGCAPRQPQRYTAQFFQLFDTLTTIVGYATSQEAFSETAEQLRAKLEEYHQLYDIYNDYPGVNNLKTINDNAGIAPVVVDERIISLLELMIQRNRETNGAVNVAMGAVLRVWHDYREAGLNDPEAAALPPMELLREAAKHTDISDIVIDKAASTVYLKDPAMRLDVGSTAKGYATEQVVQYAKSLGVESLLISVGGNVRAIGKKPAADERGESRWNVAIQNPDKSSPEPYLMSVLIEDMAVVSSGVYERYYIVEGQRYHHIIDPQTLMPATGYAAVTILSPDSATGDSLATAICILPLAEGKRIIEGMAGVEAAWVLPDGNIEYSSGFLGYVTAD